MPQLFQILLIEDNNADVVLIRKAIASADIAADLHVVTDGKAATQFIDAVEEGVTGPCPDLILLDFNLPRKNGDEVLLHLRATTRCRRAAVLIVSSSDSPREKDAVASLGVAGYFRKPSDYTEFMKLGLVVKSLLEAPQNGIERDYRQ